MSAQIRKHVLFITFSVFYLAFSFLTYKNYGITSDEEVNYRAGGVYIKYLLSSLKNRQVIEQKASPKDDPQEYPAFRLYPGLVSAINLSSSYEHAHLINLLFGYFGFFVTYWLVFDVTGSKLSIIAPLLLFLNPYYFGHVPGNPKDIPFANLYLFCVYLILKLRINKVVDYIILGIFLGLLTATRFVGATLFLFLFIKLLLDSSIRTTLPKKLLYFIITGIVSLIFLYAIWPFLWHDPVTKLVTLAKNAEAFSFWDRKILFEGILITKTERPWYYLFTYIFYKTPPLVLVGILGSVFVRSRKARFILSVVGINLVLYLIVQPVIYNEMRHFLYLVPLFTVLSSILFIKLLANKRALIYRTTFIIIMLGLVKMSYDFVVLHPYQYVYFNELAGKMSNVTKKYEVDYWSESYKESSEYLGNLALKGPVPIKVYPCNLDFGVDYYSHKDFLVVDTPEESDYIICDNLNALKKDLELENNIVFKVVRKGATLSYVAKTIK